MNRIPNWLIILVVILLIIFLANALHIVNMHGSISAEVWPNPLRDA